MKVGDVVKCVDPGYKTIMNGVYRITKIHDNQSDGWGTINCLPLSVLAKEEADNEEIRGTYTKRFVLSKEANISKLLKKIDGH